MQRNIEGAPRATWLRRVYLASAALWFWYGLEQRGRSIYLPCVGWLALDSAVIAGALVYG